MKQFASVIGLVCLVGCATAPLIDSRGPGAAPVQGMVYDLDRVPVPDARVKVGGPPGWREAVTDIHGRFVVPDVPWGTVHVVVEKTDYEPFRWDFPFTEASQVVYVQMANADQLYEAAVESLERGDWDAAQGLLDRADRIQAPGATAVFLKAVLWENQGRTAEAAELLETYLAGHPPLLAMVLRLGDLYLNRLGRPDSALVHYRRALEMKYDAQVEATVKTLESKTAP